MATTATSSSEGEACISENHELQQEEIMALKSIYEDDFHYEISEATSEVYGTLQVHPSVPDQLALQVPSWLSASLSTSSPSPSPTSPRANKNARSSSSTTDRDDSASSTYYVIQNLPPITIRFHMTRTHPRQAPLNFAIDCFWLNYYHRSKLKRKLLDIWEESRDVVLFNYADFLQHDAMTFLELIPPNELTKQGVQILKLPLATRPPEHKQSNGSPSRGMNGSRGGGQNRRSDVARAEYRRKMQEQIIQVLDGILAYDKRTVAAQFAAALHDCGICFETKRGNLCVQFGACKHVFCRECLKDYFSLLIKEGSVTSVSCPDHQCKKQAAAAQKNPEQTNVDADTTTTTAVARLSHDEIREIVGPALFDRYVELVSKQELEGRSDVVYCPRPDCQTPVIKDPKEEKLCICPKCRFAFCFYCMRCWHGYASYCAMNNMLKVVEEYLAASPAQKAYMEKRYGKKVLEKCSRDFMAEKETIQWKKANTQACPTCNSAVQKSEGCNHMTCRICETHFCFLCGAYLDKSKPYTHFNDPRSPCNMKLFQGVVFPGGPGGPGGGEGAGMWGDDPGELDDGGDFILVEDEFAWI
ncbi:E3 ubiquitin-protein ligase rnf14 [Quaeritorhiza haematococci]|nr:E3 ubiquitin-protein ligase rnf14 [Quaeritorhiza haematococci]